MNTSEAHAVRKLLRFVLNPEQARPCLEAEARRAATKLADRAGSRLGRTDRRGDWVGERWPHLIARAEPGGGPLPKAQEAGAAVTPR